jgi:hypothetical protein
MAPKKPVKKSVAKPATKVSAKPVSKSVSKPATAPAAVKLPVPAMASSCGCGCSSSGCSMCGCHVAGMLMQGKIWLGFVAAFVVIFAVEYFVHHVHLGQAYAQTAHLWRPMAEMNMWSMIGLQALVALVFTLVFKMASSCCGGVCSSVKNGVLIMAPYAIASGFAYLTQPIPAHIIQAWVAAPLVEGALAGLVLSYIFRCCCSTTCKM